MWNPKDLSAVQSINRMTWMFKNNCERRISRLWVSFSCWNEQTNTRSRQGVFGTKDCMIFLLKKKEKKTRKEKKKETKKRESESSWERNDVSESHWLFIDTYCNQKFSSAAHEISGGLSVRATLRSHPCWTHAPQPNPPPPPPPHPSLLPSPMDNMHGNLRFYYVQQPCLDYVLFLGFFEVISFSLSDISSGLMVSIRGPRGWDARRESTRLCVPFSSHVIFRHTSSGEGGDGALFFFIMVKNKYWLL